MTCIVTMTSAVVLVVVLQQLTMAAAAVPMRRRQTGACGPMDSDWIETIWESYKDKYGLSYSGSEDSDR